MTRPLQAFFIPYLLVFMVGMVTVYLQDHGDFVLWLNERHNPVLDVFFKWATYLGDGVFLAVVSVLLILFKRRYGFVLALIGISQAIVSFFLKRVVFGRVPRPKKFFDDLSQLNFVEGVDVNGFYSFPSGHTMTGFSIAFFLVFVFRNSMVSVLLLVGAILVGLSRVYLLQHFLIDILAGSLVGLFISYLGYRLSRNYLEP